MQQVVAASIAQRTFVTVLLRAFALLALLLALIGIYGVVSYATPQRTHEIGVRMALGAQASDVRKLVLRQGLWMTLAGIALGALASLGAARLMTKLLFGISATDPLTFVVVIFILILVALCACWVPAQRATKVDPLIALRHD